MLAAVLATMEKNVGTTDRYVRIVLGAVLAAVGLAGFTMITLNVVVAAALVLVGAVLVGTGLTQRCLLYQPFGIDTFRKA